MTKLSRSKIELFLECPRCFWLDLRQKIKRPPPAPYTINNAIDYLLKQEFDIYRAKGEAHPIMTQFGVKAVPYQSSKLSQWRHNFTGVQAPHTPTDFLVTGAVDATGEGEWTVKTGQKLKAPTPVIRQSFDFRRASQKHPSYIGKILSALRGQFGQHAVIIKPKKSK